MYVVTASLIIAAVGILIMSAQSRNDSKVWITAIDTSDAIARFSSIALPSLIASLLVLPPLIIWADFLAWKAAGTGGTPPTWGGYYKIRRWGLYLLFHPQDLQDPSPISPQGPTFLDAATLPRREGAHPPLTRWTLPQRQLNSPVLPQDLRQQLLSIPASLASSEGLLRTGPSITEGGHGPALFATQEIRKDANVKNIHCEVAHVHPSDSSLHVYLSGNDARLVIDKGWAMRFPVTWLAPSGWVLIFAPRDEAELHVVRGIVEAAVGYALGKKTDGG